MNKAIWKSFWIKQKALGPGSQKAQKALGPGSQKAQKAQKALGPGPKGPVEKSCNK